MNEDNDFKDKANTAEENMHSKNTDNEIENYFSYVVNILGVKSVYIERPESLSASDLNKANSAQKNYTELLILVEALASYNLVEKELLDKMVVALKIDLNKIKVIDAADKNLWQSQFVLSLLDQGQQTSVPSTKVLDENSNEVLTFSPRVLVKNPKLKKQAWDEFQKVILFFSK